MDITALHPLSLLTRRSYDVRDKTVLITGAGQGIGLELARILSARGAFVVVVDIDEIGAEVTAGELGPRALAITADVSDRAAMVAATRLAVDTFGHLDVVVANAGVTPAPATVRTMDPADFDRVMAINLDGCFNTVHPALDHIVAARGHVVVVSSCASFAPGMAGSPYMMSKAAVEQFGRALRVELAAAGASAGIAYFGVVETEMTHAMLDRDDLGRELDEMLPWPLNVRITATHAATVIADGIARRAARTIAPSGWEPYALLRGAVNVVLDAQLAGSGKVKDLLDRVERRSGR
ncbi:short-chain dehydrogenase [Nocardia sp. MH4]|uniref:short-chain dehydrogenase/reductase n=1 Tax=unclassified Nocardia TaxID=2637762 RepID=UPI001C4FB19B|nr:short-chain dehydrogenase/reductase [Nocardia sp. MH4]MBW0271665.1 short-chain dehydrogenase [Nocardia sp. MH4]